ncbi:MAG: hypothetical protein IPJ77_03875 [Planctomycetes bacterium]|nr:hypothetical protein [Planctomycetota bacterium]
MSARTARFLVLPFVLALAACGVESSTTIVPASHAAPSAPPTGAPESKAAGSADAGAKLAAAPAAKDVDLKGELRKIVAWLRGTQDLKSGSYAGGVEGTAWVLAVLADAPDHYRRVDGPFVAKALEFLAARQAVNGAIHDADATGERIAEQNALAVMALSRHADAESKALLAKALAFAGQAAAAPAATGIALPAEKDALKKLANELVAKRGADGAWDGPKGKVIESARAALALCEIYAKTTTSSASTTAVKPLPGFEDADKAKALAALQRGAQFLLAKSKNGIFEARPGDPSAGITSMAVGALQCVPEPRPAELQKAIDNALAWLVSLQQKDGSIHDGQLANYTTSAAILALSRSGRPEYKPVVEKARAWLMALQADEAEGYSPDHPYYGGNSYGDEQRPDLSNVQFALEALAASGLEKGDDAYKRALVFLQRCQNRSESNDIQMADADGKTIVSGNDGGSGYGPGTSKAGFVDLGDGRKVSRSYGSMSYALLKGYILCGLPKDDPRMKACWEWLRKNYTLDVNPGFESSSEPNAPYQGLFYYLHTMAKTLSLYGEETIVDAAGKANPWRKQLCGRLVAMQKKEDGSWVNENASRWWEGNPVLATTYALLSIDAAMPK